MKKIFISIMLVLGFGLGAYANDNTPEGVILSYREAIKKGDLEKAKSYLDEKSFDNIAPNGRKNNSVNKKINGSYSKLKYGGDISQWTFKIKKTDELSAGDYEVYYTNPTAQFESTRNGTDFLLVNVKKINGKWKLTYVG